MKYHFRVEKEKKGFSAQCIEFEGCVTQGDSMKELVANMEEALNLYVFEPEDSKELVSLPDKKIKASAHIIEVPLDPEIAFSFMLRYHRIKNNLTQHQAAEKMGFKSLYSYQRLEKKCNVTIDIIARVKKLFPDFSIDLAFA
jgi:predicted RNase H-like HicB family nuclease